MAKRKQGAPPKPIEDAPTPPLPSENRVNQWLVLGLILLAGLALRVVYFHEIVHEPEFAHPALDPQFNDYWARAMVSGDWTPPEGYPDPMIRTTPHGRPPGYPYFLAFIYWLSGSSYNAPRIVQMGIGLLNGVVMFLFARALFNKTVGLIAAAFMVTYWVFIHFEGELTYPSVVVLISLLMMHVLRRWTLKPSLGKAFLAGLLLGVFALFRPNVVLFGPAVVAWMFWVLDGRRHLRIFLASSAVITAGTLLAIAPPLIRNYVVAHDFVFLSSYGGVNIYAAYNDITDCVTPKIPHLKEIAGFEDWSCFHYPTIVRGVGRMLGKEDIKFSEASSYFYQQGRQYILQHPVRSFGLVLKKAAIFWGPIETTNDKVLHYVKKNSRLLHLMPGFPAVLALFVVGLGFLIQEWRRRIGVDRGFVAVSGLLVVFIFTYFSSVVIYFVAGRYRVPVIPFLLLIGAYGVWRIAGLFREKANRKAGAWCIAGFCVYVVGSIPLTSYKPDLAIWHHQRAKAYEDAGDIDNTLLELREELKINPDYPDAHSLLAGILIKQGKVDEGIAEYRETLRLDPKKDLAYNNLGFEMAKQGKDDEAAKFYAEAMRLNPNLPIAHNNLGNLYFSEGRYEDAAAQYKQALRIDPADRFAEYNLANALRSQNKSEEAIAYYKRAMQRDAKNPDIPNNLGLTLADQGKSEEAIRYYNAALGIDPKYAKAHNNIGFEYAKQGKKAEALREYEEALKLDPKLTPALNNMGKLSAGEGKTEEAIGRYRRALELDPKDKQAHLNLGDLLMARERYDEAIDEYTKALANDPRNADIPNNLANALVRKARFEEAVKYYNQALSINPRNAAAHCNLGAILEATGKREDAAAHFKKALESDPNSKVARDGLSRVSAGH